MNLDILKKYTVVPIENGISNHNVAKDGILAKWFLAHVIYVTHS